jgi:hypothetical protein
MVSLKITNEDDNYSKEVELILKKPGTDNLLFVFSSNQSF